MNIGDRMKRNYEDRYRFYLTRRTPIIVRVDGRSFHSVTRDFQRPFDMNFINSMRLAAISTLVEDGIQGFKLAYTQSDECSFLFTDYDTLETDGWFDYNKSKIETILASTFTLHFNNAIKHYYPDFVKTAVFDARSFNIPPEDVTNYFLWRAKDWERNSLSMYCRSFFSDKELHGKNRGEQHEMLHQKGKNWTTDLTPVLRNGTFITRDLMLRDDIFPTFEDIDSILDI